MSLAVMFNNVGTADIVGKSLVMVGISLSTAEDGIVLGEVVGTLVAPSSDGENDGNSDAISVGLLLGAELGASVLRGSVGLSVSSVG